MRREDKEGLKHLKALNQERYAALESGILEMFRKVSGDVLDVIARTPEHREAKTPKLIKQEGNVTVFDMSDIQPDYFELAAEMRHQYSSAVSMSLDQDRLQMEGPAIARALIAEWAKVQMVAMPEVYDMDVLPVQEDLGSYLTQAENTLIKFQSVDKRIEQMYASHSQKIPAEKLQGISDDNRLFRAKDLLHSVQTIMRQNVAETLLKRGAKSPASPWGRTMEML